MSRDFVRRVASRRMMGVGSVTSERGGNPTKVQSLVVEESF